MLPKTPDPLAKRYQVTELPAFEPTRPSTADTASIARDAAVDLGGVRVGQDPKLPFGPRLMSTVALLTGVYHLSRRRTVELLSDGVGLSISLGAVSAVEARVSEAVAPAVDEAC